MKASSLLISFLIFYLARCARSVKLRSLAPEAISGILKDFFAKQSTAVDVINFWSYKNGKVVDELLRNKCDEISIRVVFGENCCNNSLNISSFLIFDSANKFKEVLKKRRKRGRHRIYSKWIPDRQRQLSDKRKRKIDRTRGEFHVHTEEVSPESVYDDQQIQEKHDEVGKLKLLPEEVRKHS